MLKLHNVNLSYVKDYYALCDVNAEFSENVVYNVIGENSSGKSTLLRCVAKLEDEYTGEITYNDVDIKKYDFSKELGVGYMPEEAVFLGDKTTVLENIKYAIKNRQIVPFEEEDYYIAQLLEAFKLSKVKDKKIKKLSYFEKQKLALARLSMRKLNILLIDNIFASLGSDEIAEIFTYLKEYFINQNMIILLASHKPLKEYFEETIEVHMNAGIIQKEKQEDDK